MHGRTDKFHYSNNPVKDFAVGDIILFVNKLQKYNSMSYKIYHNTRCRKSRAGLQYLEDKGIKPEIIEYLKDQPFSEKSLGDILNKLGLKPMEIIRTQEADYRQKYKGKDFSGKEWIKILVENPKLIRRPIIVKNDMAVLGDIVQHIDALL